MEIAQATSRPEIGDSVVVITDQDVPRHGLVVAHYDETKFVLKGGDPTASDQLRRHTMYDIRNPLAWMATY